MISLTTIKAIRGILLSDRVAYKGTEIQGLQTILHELAIEENAQTLAARIKVQPPEKSIQDEEG